MATPTIPNVWYHRKVGDNAAKSCWICYKPSVNVLITPDNKDFFYICAGHLKDRGFAIPDKDEVEALEARKKKAELDAEIEKVKKEYTEKLQKKAEKRKEKDKKKKDKSKEEEKKEEEEDKADEKERDDKIKALEKGKDTQTTGDDGPRIFSLQKNFYQQRLDRIRTAEMARRNRERIKNPASFPSAPTGDLA